MNSIIEFVSNKKKIQLIFCFTMAFDQLRSIGYLPWLLLLPNIYVWKKAQVFVDIS
jgi:hypothetical protein